MVIGEVLFSGVQARLSVVCAYGFLNRSGGTKTLGRLDTGWGQQRNHLFHRTEDIAVGIYPGKLVLHRALWGQPQGVAQGGNFLTTHTI
jgi:hypothetical protein